MALLQVHNLTKTYGTHIAVDELSFDIHEGRCMALLGPNGAGKTTTLKMLSGLLTPTSGSIQFRDGNDQDIRKSIGYLPQYPSFYNWMTGLEYVAFSGQLAHMTKKEASIRAKELFELVGLKDAGRRRIGGYSGGMKQRLGLAQAMIHKPRLIILDEPVSALDPIGRREVIELLKQMKSETTILFSTHVLHDVEEISDDIMIIRNGQLILRNTMSQIKSESRQPIFNIQVEPQDSKWLKKLSSNPHVLKVEHSSDTTAVVHVMDIQLARPLLLKEIADCGIRIEKFEVDYTTLEELFMKAVQE